LISGTGYNVTDVGAASALNVTVHSLFGTTTDLTRSRQKGIVYWPGSRSETATRSPGRVERPRDQQQLRRRPASLVIGPLISPVRKPERPAGFEAHLSAPRRSVRQEVAFDSRKTARNPLRIQNEST
jgi:hypothetical protein